MSNFKKLLLDNFFNHENIKNIFLGAKTWKRVVIQFSLVDFFSDITFLDTQRKIYYSGILNCDLRIDVPALYQSS